MSELRLLMGLPACGKTTYAVDLITREPNWIRINWDQLRKDKGLTGLKFNRAEEDKMQKESFEFAEMAGSKGLNVVVDNTNLSENTRNRWKGVAQRAHMVYTEVNLNQPLAVCIGRDSKREDSVGRPVIERMALFAGLIKFPQCHEIVIVDVDGTVADCSHRKHFLEQKPCPECGGILSTCLSCNGRGLTKKDHDSFFAAAHLDTPIQPIIDLVRLLWGVDYKIVIVSGRPIDKGGRITVDWLEKYMVPFDHIFMRNGGDHRPDDIVKQEILNKLPKHKIKFVLDDRNSVVSMWRRNGLTCLQVADGKF